MSAHSSLYNIAMPASMGLPSEQAVQQHGLNHQEAPVGPFPPNNQDVPVALPPVQGVGAAAAAVLLQHSIHQMVQKHRATQEEMYKLCETAATKMASSGKEEGPTDFVRSIHQTVIGHRVTQEQMYIVFETVAKRMLCLEHAKSHGGTGINNNVGVDEASSSSSSREQQRCYNPDEEKTGRVTSPLRESALNARYETTSKAAAAFAVSPQSTGQDDDDGDEEAGDGDDVVEVVVGVNSEPAAKNDEDPEDRISLIRRKRKFTSSDHDTLLSDYRLLCETMEYVHHDKDWTVEEREQFNMYSRKRKAKIAARLGNLLCDMDKHDSK